MMGGRGTDDDTGAAMVELALILPLLVAGARVLVTGAASGTKVSSRAAQWPYSAGS